MYLFDELFVRGYLRPFQLHGAPLLLLPLVASAESAEGADEQGDD